ncbi:MAG: hypothetical protein ABI206_11745 [Antricoccus sp.]
MTDVLGVDSELPDVMWRARYGHTAHVAINELRISAAEPFAYWPLL